MLSFVKEVASSLYARYGDDLSSLKMLFPSRRAQLFFCDALTQVATHPLWQPDFVTIDQLMGELGELQPADNIKLITELYKVYSRYHQETFDAFYFWGDLLLADFDTIDKYLIDADMLFANIRDLRAMEDDHSYLTQEQKRIIAQFWSSFGNEAEFSREQEHFLAIWNTLAPIYHAFREHLEQQGIAYMGMIHRRAVERIRSNESVQLFGEERFVVAGFNALTACEKVLFAWMQKSGRAEFYWDYDPYYVYNPQHEAGLFLSDNLAQFPIPDDVSITTNHFSAPKNIVAVAAPSDSLQCKYVHTFLQELLDHGLKPDKETAIVLTDESLLLPVLHAIPEGIEAVNVTMGYPLRQTTAYTFVERLLELQHRRRMKGDATLFYHSDVIGLLGHPYLLENFEPICMPLVEQLQRRGQVYVRASQLPDNGIVAHVFSETSDWKSLSLYVRELLSEVGALPCVAEDVVQRRGLFSLMIDHICQLENALADADVEVTVPVYASLLRKILQGVRIPYEGEPLAGVQVMGILETRNLDFENVLLISVNDDTFPGNRVASSSFIPYNLRFAYGLPTPQHHEGVYAYYFYRLMQRAEQVHLLYCSRSDDKHTGEPSRYLYQLRYESPHEVMQREIPLHVNLVQNKALQIEKRGAVAEALTQFLGEEGRQLSPTSFNTYIECPLKFYFKSIARLSPEKEISEEIDLPMFGTILHKAMELLYAPLVGQPNVTERIDALRKDPKVEACVREAINNEYLHDFNASEEEYSGNMLLVRDIVVRYIRTCLLAYDATHENFVVKELERHLEAPFHFSVSGRPLQVTFGGKADRVDLLADGRLRVVDYKTGGSHNVFNGIEALFGTKNKMRSGAVLQTLLYSLMLHTADRSEVQPALYYVRQMNREDYSPLLVDGVQSIEHFTDYLEPLREKLSEKLALLFDLDTPFMQCEDETTCEFCDFRALCRR